MRERRGGRGGLGLYIARDIVTSHGGAIDVASLEQSSDLFAMRMPSGKSQIELCTWTRPLTGAGFKKKIQ